MVEVLKISNLSNANKFIFLFPIRNFNRDLESKLNHFLSNLKNFRHVEIIILDKTNDINLHKYLNSNFDDISRVTIFKRPFNESIFDSQKFIKLDNDCWLLQVHDDDSIEGITEICKFDTLKDETILLNVLDQFRMPLADFNPNRYIFSFIPANIWNVFVTYLLLQDSHISYSVDIILSDLVRSLSNKPYYSNINYIYTDRWNHTSNLYKRSHIINLTRLDGWDFLANKFIFIFNARIDFLVYAKYFSNFFDNKNYIHKLHSALENLRNTYRFKYLWTLIYLIFNKLIKIKFLQNKNYFNKIRYTSLIIYKCVRIEDATDLITLIYDLKNISHLHLLQKRFDFWIKILES